MGEEAVGDLARTLMDNPLFSQALARAFSAGEQAVAAQRSALSALDVATGSDVDRLERRVRSLSDRVAELEDQLDELRSQLKSKGA